MTLRGVITPASLGVMTPDRPKREVFALSLALRERLSDLADDFLDEENDALEDELSALIQRATQGLCIHCGSYKECPCDDMADQIATGGY